MIHSKLKPILGWAILLALSYGAEILLHEPRRVALQLLPASIFSLNRDFLLGIGMTFAASLLAWIVAVFGGFGLGVMVAATMLN